MPTLSRPSAGTALGATRDRHPDDDTQARRYETADRVLEAAGLAWYEISNWSRRRSRVPSQPELLAPRRVPRAWAAPPTATSAVAGSGTSGPRSATWRRSRPAGSAAVGEERLDSEHRLLEALELAVRTREGVVADALPDDEQLVGLVAREHGRAVLDTFAAGCSPTRSPAGSARRLVQLGSAGRARCSADAGRRKLGTPGRGRLPVLCHRGR